MHELIVPQRFRARGVAGLRRFGNTGDGALIGKISELVAMRSDGSQVPVELSISTVEIRGSWHAIGIIGSRNCRGRSGRNSACRTAGCTPPRSPR